MKDVLREEIKNKGIVVISLITDDDSFPNQFVEVIGRNELVSLLFALRNGGIAFVYTSSLNELEYIKRAANVVGFPIYRLSKQTYEYADTTPTPLISFSNSLPGLTAEQLLPYEDHFIKKNSPHEVGARNSLQNIKDELDGGNLDE